MLAGPTQPSPRAGKGLCHPCLGWQPQLLDHRQGFCAASAGRRGELPITLEKVWPLWTPMETLEMDDLGFMSLLYQASPHTSLLSF